MPHGNLRVERGQRHGECRGGVSVHEHDVGRRLIQHGCGTGQNAARELRQRLALAHDVQVVVNVQVEQARHLVEHLAMLCGGQHAHVEGDLIAQRAHDRRHLHRLGSRAERRENPHRFAHEPPSFRCRKTRTSPDTPPLLPRKKKGPVLLNRPPFVRCALKQDAV